MHSVVEKANGGTWLRELLVEALRDFPGDVTFQELNNAIQAVLPAVVHPFDVCRLAGAYVMVNRRNLRESLKELDTPNGRRILIVTAKDALGKSHSVQLILYGWNVRENFRPILIDLEEMSHKLGIGALTNPRELGKRLVKELGYALTVPEEPTDALWSKWVSEFIDTLSPHAQNERIYTWIVLDQINRVTLTEPTLDLIKSIAVRVNTTWKQFRLVLLGYQDALPSECSGHIQREEVNRIDEKEVVRFFIDAFEQLKRPKNDDEIAKIAQKVLDQVPLNQPDSHKLLHPVASAELALALKGGS